MFVVDCYIKNNTPDIVGRVENLGYKIDSSVSGPKSIWLYAQFGTLYGIGCDTETPDETPENVCDRWERCTAATYCDSAELFIALCALNPSTNFNQWFTDGKDYIVLTENNAISLMKRGFTKMSRNDLINHFSVSDENPVAFIVSNDWSKEDHTHGECNGYVVLPPSNFLYGHSKEDLNKYIRIHGGITLSGLASIHTLLLSKADIITEGKTIIPDDWFIIGFDTLHYDDNLTNWSKEAVIKETFKLWKQVNTFNNLPHDADSFILHRDEDGDVILHDSYGNCICSLDDRLYPWIEDGDKVRLSVDESHIF